MERRRQSTTYFYYVCMYLRTHTVTLCTLSNTNMCNIPILKVWIVLKQSHFPHLLSFSVHFLSSSKLLDLGWIHFEHSCTIWLIDPPIRRIRYDNTTIRLAFYPNMIRHITARVPNPRKETNVKKKIRNSFFGRSTRLIFVVMINELFIVTLVFLDISAPWTKVWQDTRIACLVR